jgi:hypothetical protein
MPEPREILMKAADVIDQRGWFQGLSEDPNGTAVCAMGALCVAVALPPDANCWGFGDDDLCAANAAADRFENWVEGDLSITEWNDTVAESAEQVTTALRGCAAALAGGAS